MAQKLITILKILGYLVIATVGIFCLVYIPWLSIHELTPYTGSPLAALKAIDYVPPILPAAIVLFLIGFFWRKKRDMGLLAAVVVVGSMMNFTVCIFGTISLKQQLIAQKIQCESKPAISCKPLK